jgi:hypothetical protein
VGFAQLQTILVPPASILAFAQGESTHSFRGVWVPHLHSELIKCSLCKESEKRPRDGGRSATFTSRRHRFPIVQTLLYEFLFIGTKSTHFW